MAATNGELEARMIVVEAAIESAVQLVGYPKDVNAASVEVGDLVIGIKAGINSGLFFVGNVTTAPPTSDAHITFEFQAT